MEEYAIEFYAKVVIKAECAEDAYEFARDILTMSDMEVYINGNLYKD